MRVVCWLDGDIEVNPLRIPLLVKKQREGLANLLALGHAARMPIGTAPHSSRKQRSGFVPRHGLARVISKMGIASRTEAARWIEAGRVAVNGRMQRDPEYPTAQGSDRIQIDGREVDTAPRVYLMLNKPRGLVTTAHDEQGRDTVYECLDDPSLPTLQPVGRLDKASEGLLLFCNDPEWAARIADPASGPDKTYHVQIDCVPDAAMLARLMKGIDCDGERLSAKSATLLRHGAKNAWLEVVLDEGRNRQIRRLLASQDISVLRLLRVAIGALELGALGKGAWRKLSDAEINGLVDS